MTIKPILTTNPSFDELAQAIVNEFDFDDIDHLLGEGENTFEIDEYTIEVLPDHHGRYSDEIYVSGPNLKYTLKN